MTEPRASSDGSASAEDWLDGLAGRAGSGSEHADGKLLRDTLQVHAGSEMPPWAEIEQRAGVLTAYASVEQPQPQPQPQAQAQAPAGRAAAAANAPQWRVWAGVAAALVLGIGLAMSMWPATEAPGMRGAGGGEALWLVASPRESADSLAAELQALGAEVVIHSEGADTRLAIAASQAAAPAVNQRLAMIETALDAQGRLTLRLKAR